ncbi:MAG: HAMP domain-containing histidine kinase [Clostridia bacterium]|nr:HAMP domain-containing histidine kinase [Clostridia bacterium]
MLNNMGREEEIKMYNFKILALTKELKENYPDAKSSEIIEILTREDVDYDILEKYGYNTLKEPVVYGINEIHQKYLVYEILVALLFIFLLVSIYFKKYIKNERQIARITDLVNEINHKNYDIKLDEEVDGELSILQDEIYKTMILLKESAENSYNDKMKVKEAVEDISHQLKTPLTAILINIDNLSSDLEDKSRKAIYRELKSKAYSMKFLIESLLKLSKFDVNVIDFNEKMCMVSELVDVSVNSVLTLADLKNIKIIVSGSGDEKMLCDINWQKEAITNILKNALEHSKENSSVYVNYTSNKMFSLVTITNEGTISRKDLTHIFDRFYKGKDSSENSTGIGLALANAIVKKGRGKIAIKCESGKVIFEVKYFKSNY